MPSIPLPLRSGAFYIDNSTLESYVDCPRKSEFTNWRRRISTNDKPALSFGQIMHICLDYRYSTFGSDLNESNLAKCERAQSWLIQKHFETSPCPPEDWRNANWALELCKNYNRRYQIEPFNILKDSETGEPLVEKSFKVLFLAYNPRTSEVQPCYAISQLPIGWIAIYYIGKIDMIVSWDNLINVWDHKNFSTLGDTFHDKMRVNPQFLGYAWAWWRITGQIPSGFIVNAIRTREAPMKSPKGGMVEWWNQSFTRVKESLVDESPLVEWEKNVTILIEEMLWHARRGVFPTHKTSCAQYGKCPFYHICYNTDPTQREEMLMGQNYTENLFDPLNEHKKLYKEIPE